MKNSLRILGIGMIAAAAFALAAQDAWTLKRTANVGDVARYKLVADVELPGMGGAKEGPFEILEISREARVYATE